MIKLSALLLIAASHAALAQDNFAWSENAGWLNWSAANGDDQGPRIVDGSLSGFVWGENIGWINLGDGGLVPDRALQTGSDFGVGIDAQWDLYGFAWSENCGWINFGPYEDGVGGPIEICRCDVGITDCADSSCVSAQPRIVRGVIRGYAWSENLGWVNMDDPDHQIQIACAPDMNFDGTLDFFDLSIFLGFLSNEDPRADWDDNGSFDFFALSGYLFFFNQGCP